MLSFLLVGFTETLLYLIDLFQIRHVSKFFRLAMIFFNFFILIKGLQLKRYQVLKNFLMMLIMQDLLSIKKSLKSKCNFIFISSAIAL